MVLFFSCSRQEEPVQGAWIQGDEAQKIATIEKQFRGFDLAMMEIGYRYQELYWAGQDENWEYADYQLEHLEVALRNGLERRPKRAQSAQHFLNRVLPDMQEAVAGKDTAAFKSQYDVLTANCNSCHAMEKVPFFTVEKPVRRLSPIKKE